ncbi:hypothetical protein NBRC111894_2745 [Sporolactobacillus inulinus]|uniref:Uncharacterized protein n=1 Tax=Sporolactobacillus inulinus TaxID=2078 RepID=A0A4Y1ZE19_9BACL|nr:hypothetical protein NBRC111894_2745 [Sporolactobacillus inulinus]
MSFFEILTIIIPSTLLTAAPLISRHWAACSRNDPGLSILVWKG